MRGIVLAGVIPLVHTSGADLVHKLPPKLPLFPTCKAKGEKRNVYLIFRGVGEMQDGGIH